MKNDKLLVYLERKKTKILVGTLERKSNKYIFIYDEKYFFSEKPIQFGPKLPLSKRKYSSCSLFDIFKDRIPSRNNPAYEDYCKQVGISKNERDEMVLLSTLGARGPSSFIIERPSGKTFGREELKIFRERLKLSMRDFASLFDISLSSVEKIENGKVRGTEVLKRIEIYSKFKEVAKYEVIKNKAPVHTSIVSDVLKIIEAG